MQKGWILALIAAALSIAAAMWIGVRHEPYDVIIIGGGTAGSIVATKLVEENPDKRILLIDAGGPLSQKVGGRDVPPYSDGPTYFDIPGEYQNIVFSRKAKSYTIAQSSFCYQGKGFGGTSQINGMCFQIPRGEDFDSWPGSWNLSALQPYFKNVLGRMPVTTTPSADGKPYNNAVRKIFSKILEKQGFHTGDTLRFSKDTNDAFGRLHVVAENGERAGPVTAYLTSILDENGKSKRGNFDVLPYCPVEGLAFAKKDPSRVSGVVHQCGKYPLKKDGHVILCAGALHTPRLLLLSGVGPKGREKEIFGIRSHRGFSIDNPDIGTSLHDHTATMITFSYVGSIPYRGYEYGNYEKNSEDLRFYKEKRSGPYAQYGTVFLALGSTADRAEGPDFEVMINPHGTGGPNFAFGAPNAISTYIMPLYPKARGILTIDNHLNALKPDMYLNNDDDKETMARAVQKFIRLAESDGDLRVLFGPGGQSHPRLNANNFDDVVEFVTPSGPIMGMEYTGLITHHFGGGCPLRDGDGGVDPATLLVRGTKNVHVIDASLIPEPLGAHPIATIMAMAEKGAEVVGAQLPRKDG